MSQAEFTFKMFHKALILIDLLINFFFQIFSILIKAVIWVVVVTRQLEMVVVALALFRVISIKTTNTLLMTGLND